VEASNNRKVIPYHSRTVEQKRNTFYKFIEHYFIMFLLNMLQPTVCKTSPATADLTHTHKKLFS
jgi:hypothetical protein